MEPLTTAEKVERVVLLIAVIAVLADVFWIRP
jgi:hypothetical protein